jgi:hypothetical protein
MKSPAALTIGAIVVITIISGIVQGKLSGRWGPSVDLIAAGRTLHSLPQKIGNWEMSSELEVSDVVRRMLRCTGSTHRRYFNRETGQAVNMVLIVGPPGPISVHIPEICFSSQAYTQQGERESRRVKAADGSREGDFWALTFRPNDLDSLPLRVYYAWSSGDRWQAVDNPRYTRSGSKVLYKIQLAGDLRDTLSKESPELDPCKSFLEQMLALPEVPGGTSTSTSEQVADAAR